MIRAVLLLLSLSLGAFAQGFEAFLQQALQNNTDLQTAKSHIAQTREQAKTLYRYDNPTLEGTLARYDKRDGYSLGIDQSIPLPSTRSNRQKVAKLLVKKAEANYQLQKARLIRALSRRYLDYKTKASYALLAEEESRLSHQIYMITKARFAAGTIPRSKLLQAKIAYQKSQKEALRANLERLQSRYDLLLEAGIYKDETIEANHTFRPLSRHTSHPLLTLASLETALTRARAATQTQTVTAFGLKAEYEKEPDQDIVRVGVSLPLGIFNRKHEEKAIARLALANRNFTRQKLQARFALLRKKLSGELSVLEPLSRQNATLLEAQQKMLGLFEEGYKIANINLLELQNIKNSLIQTRKEQIDIQKALDLNTIKQNYLNGAYND